MSCLPTVLMLKFYLNSVYVGRERKSDLRLSERVRNARPHPPHIQALVHVAVLIIIREVQSGGPIMVTLAANSIGMMEPPQAQAHAMLSRDLLGTSPWGKCVTVQ